jgi:hypothetical protein
MSSTSNVSLLEGRRRSEYEQVNNNIRHYSSLRFAIITVFFAATGGIASVSFGLFGNQSADSEFLRICARFAGLLVTLLFLQYECLIGEVLSKNREIGRDLEKIFGSKQIASRSQVAITISHVLARALYISFLLFWALMIWSALRPVPVQCDQCV